MFRTDENAMKLAKRSAELNRVNSIAVNFISPSEEQSFMPKYQVAMPRNYLRQQGIRKVKERRRVPYASIDVIFNNKTLYANLQLPDPTTISYNFNDATRWAAFPVVGLKEDVFAFYTQKSMRMKATPKQIKLKNVETAEMLKNGWLQIRNLEYGFYTTFYEENVEINDRLLLEEELGIYTLEDSAAENYSKVPLVNRPSQSSGFRNNENLRNARKEWSEKLMARLPEGCQYKEKLFFFRHSDPLRIVEAVLSQCRTPEFLSCPDYLNPHFCVAVRVHRLPASVCATRVIVACVSFNPESVQR